MQEVFQTVLNQVQKQLKSGVLSLQLDELGKKWSIAVSIAENQQKWLSFKSYEMRETDRSIYSQEVVVSVKCRLEYNPDFVMV